MYKSHILSRMTMSCKSFIMSKARMWKAKPTS